MTTHPTDVRRASAGLARAAALLALSGLAGACSAHRGAGEEGAAAPAPASPGQVSTIPADAAGGQSIDRLFAGKFAGVDVKEVNGGIQIRIRGAGSYASGQEPLYVLDGSPLPAGNGGIMQLNPYDIEKIEVLKNPADTGIYGARGVNGVVRITTRRPPGRK